MKRPVGRPTKYRAKFCKLLIEHMKRGLSFESFAGHPKVQVARSNIYEWRDKHPDFQDAFKRGSSASDYYLENMALTASLQPKELPVNTGLFCFLLKNRLGWKNEDGDGGDQPTSISLNYKLDGE